MYNNKCVGLAFQQDKLYLLSLSKNVNAVSTENENSSSSMNASDKRKRVHDTSSKLWHCRLGHILRGRIVRLIKKSILPPLEFSDLERCLDCIKGKYVSTPNFCPMPRTCVASGKGLLDGAVDSPSFSTGWSILHTPLKTCQSI